MCRNAQKAESFIVALQLIAISHLFPPKHIMNSDERRKKINESQEELNRQQHKNERR